MTGEPAHATAEDIVRSSASLVTQLERLPGTADAARLLEALAATERALAGVYERLGAVHERTGIRDLRSGDAGDLPGSSVRWITADVALRTAAAFSRGAADALGRAHHEEDVALWFDVMEADG